jgi:hypothetical protein
MPPSLELVYHPSQWPRVGIFGARYACLVASGSICLGVALATRGGLRECALAGTLRVGIIKAIRFPVLAFTREHIRRIRRGPRKSEGLFGSGSASGSF